MVSASIGSMISVAETIEVFIQCFNGRWKGGFLTVLSVFANFKGISNSLIIIILVIVVI